MDLQVLSLPAVIVVLVTTLTLLIARNWRYSLLALGFQYIGVFLLVAARWSLEMAVVKVVAGWMACAVLGMAMGEAYQSSDKTWVEAEQSPSSRIFRIFASGLVGLTILSISPRAFQWLPGVIPAQIWGAFILIGMGMLHLGFTLNPLRVVIGLLTILSGCEILYSALESSALVAGLLAAVTLGLALIGAYLFISPSSEGEEPE